MKPHPLLTRLILGAGLVLLAPAPGRGQVPLYGQPDIDGMVGELAGRVRQLGEVINAELGQAPGGRYMIDDTQEMATAIDEFRQSLQARPDPAQAGQVFAGIDQTWQNVRARLTRPGAFSTDNVNRAIVRVDEMVVQVRQRVNLNPPPPAYNGYGGPPTGVSETQRLAHALESRARSLASAIQASMAGDPNAVPLTNDAVRLIQVADTFHDSIDTNQPIEVAAQAFAPVAQLADRIGQVANSGRVPPPVQQAWQAFASAEYLIQQNLGLNSPPPQGAYTLAPPPGGGPSPIIGLSGQLVDQINAYIATFSTTARHEPEGMAALSDAQRLMEAASAFRQEAARGQAANQLAYQFRDVDANWQRLARRAARIARGRNGPYVQQVQAIGGTCDQIRGMLGMPGFSPQLPGQSGPVPPPPPPGSGQFAEAFARRPIAGAG